VVQSVLKALERCLWTMEDFRIQPDIVLLQISCIFLKIIAPEYMFRPASDLTANREIAPFPDDVDDLEAAADVGRCFGAELYTEYCWYLMLTSSI